MQEDRRRFQRPSGRPGGRRLRKQERGLVGDVDGDAQVGGDVGHAHSDVGGGAEPQLAAVGEPGGQDLGDQKTAGVVAGGDRGGLVEDRARVENLDDLGVRVADGFAVLGAEPSQDGRQLTGAGVVDALQEPVVAGDRQSQHVVIGQAVGPVAAHHVDREVLVDHDHRKARRAMSVGLVGMLAAQVSVGDQIGVQGGLELRLQIAPGDPAQDLPALRRQSRVTGAATPAAFLEDFLTNTHAHQSAAVL